MRPNEKSRVPVAGITDQSEIRDLPRGARNAGGMTDKPIIFSGPMVRALLDGRKTQTRRVLKPWPGRQANWLSMDTLHRAPTCYLYEVGGHLGAQMQHPLAMTVQFYGKVDEMSPLTWVRLAHAPGDRLWVRESWRPSVSAVDPWHVAVLYTADSTVKHWGWSSDADFGDWIMPKQAAKGNVPSIHMPRWASRLTLVVTDVRVQRLQEVSEADAIAEGVERAARGIETGWRDYSGDSQLVGGARSSFCTLWDSINAKRGFGWDANPWVVATTFTVHRCNIDQMEDTQ